MNQTAATTPPPFEATLGDVRAILPPVLQEQFFLPLPPSHSFILEGRMARIWHRPAWLWPVFWLLARFDILFPETGNDIPARLEITAGRNARLELYHRWNRTFSFAFPRCFNAVMIYDDKLKRVTERLGPAGLIQMAWNVSFLPPATIDIASERCYLTLGRRHLLLPRLLYPSVHVIETAIAADAIHVGLTVSHPFLGAIFGYEGSFRALHNSPLITHE